MFGKSTADAQRIHSITPAKLSQTSLEVGQIFVGHKFCVFVCEPHKCL